MSLRITIACPEAMIADANQLARAIGSGPTDDRTYGAPQWQDAGGNLYAAASCDVSGAWLAAARSPLKAPAWGADLAAAARAQAAMRIWTAETEDELPVATAERITVILSVPGPAALALIGLSGIAEDGDGEASGA